MISDLRSDHVVEGVFAVKTKRKLQTKAGAPYLALELVDPSGRIEARVWNDVELLDGRFAEGRRGARARPRRAVPRPAPARRAHARGDRRRPGEPDADRCAATPTSSHGFLEFLAGEITHDGLAATVRAVLADCDLAAYPATPDDHHSYAGGLLEHTVGVATLCRETAQLHPRLRGELLVAAALAPRRRPHARADARAGVHADRRGAPARPRPPRAAADRGARRGPDRRRSAPSCSTASPSTTTPAPRARPRRRCSTTRTSSTRSPRPGPSE